MHIVLLYNCRCKVKIEAHQKFILIKLIVCKLQVVTIDTDRLISKKQNNKANAEGARLPKEN